MTSLAASAFALSLLLLALVAIVVLLVVLARERTRRAEAESELAVTYARIARLKRGQPDDWSIPSLPMTSETAKLVTRPPLIERTPLPPARVVTTRLYDDRCVARRIPGGN